MKIKHYKFLLVIVSFLILIGCGKNDLEAYNSAIQKGIDTLSIENYEKSIFYFELALEEKPDDEKAVAYLKQTQLYNEAKKAFEIYDFKTAKDKAKSVTDFNQGSQSLIIKSNEILSRINDSEKSMNAFQNQYDEIVKVLDSENFDAALEKVNILLNEMKIDDNYFSEIISDSQELKNDIERRKNASIALVESISEEPVELIEGPSNNEMLPNLHQYGQSFAELRNSSDDDTRLHPWKLEIEEYYGYTIRDINNQQIADYLLSEHNEIEEFEKMMEINDREIEENAQIEAAEYRVRAEEYLQIAEDSINSGDQSDAWNILIQGGIGLREIESHEDLKQRAYELAIQLEGHEMYLPFIEEKFGN